MRAAALVLGFLLIIGPIIFRFPARTVNYSPSVSFLWHTDFEKSTERPPAWEKDQVKPFNAVVNQDAKGTVIQFPDRKKTISGEDHAFAGMFASGYFLFEKTGKDVAFYSSSDELLWKKPFPSYPVTDAYGNLLLLMTGDGNRVDLMDPSGNPVGDQRISGNFLSDYQFASRSNLVALLFGGGGLYIVNDKGKIINRFGPETEQYFYKSCALSPTGNTAALHILEGKTDAILLLKLKDGKAKVAGEIKLAKIYPFTVSMAVTDSLSILFAPPDSTTFYSGDDQIWTVPYKAAGGRYAISDLGYLAVMGETKVSVYQESGAELAGIPIPNGEGPRKLIPAAQPGSFILRSFKDLSYYSFHAM